MERTPLDKGKKKHKTIEEVEMSKMPTIITMFLAKFVDEKWVNRPHISVYEKILQNLGLKGNIN